MQNPITQIWLQAQLTSEHPRLILTPELLQKLCSKAQEESHEALVYNQIKEQATRLLVQPPLDRSMDGRRMLKTSRKALGRTTALAITYLIEQDAVYLNRLEDELLALCAFEDWNPSHFLDVAEMAVAVALPLDWCGAALSEETRLEVKEALYTKALLPGMEDNPDYWWINCEHNWNLVCHGSLAIAALAVFEDYPKLATQVIHRSIEKMPLGTLPYAPSGAYNEGPTYWFYATDFLTMTLQAFRTGLGTDFNFTSAPGFKDSARYSLLAGSPSGDFYNYSDNYTGGYLGFEHLGLLAWFVPELGKDLPVQTWARLPAALEAKGFPTDRMSVFYLLYLANKPAGLPELSLPKGWAAEGSSPLGFLPPQSDNGLYLASKGGSAEDNHAHMDAGSFILEWRKIRWAIDPGKLEYKEIEAAIGAAGFWSNKQDAARWSLIACNNFGHSTLTVNETLHQAKGRALLIDKDFEAANPSLTFDLSKLYDSDLSKAHRTFKRLSENSLQIIDDITLSESTRSLTWHMMTTAEVVIQDQRALLRQSGETLALKVVSPANFEMRVVALDPPPLPYDIHIPNLKRIEIFMTPEHFNESKSQIVVELTGQI